MSKADLDLGITKQTTKRTDPKFSLYWSDLPSKAIIGVKTCEDVSPKKVLFVSKKDTWSKNNSQTQQGPVITFGISGDEVKDILSSFGGLVN